jgi:hypothetical protein
MGSQLFRCGEAKTARAAQDNSPLIQKLFIHSPDVKIYAKKGNGFPLK